MKIRKLFMPASCLAPLILSLSTSHADFAGEWPEDGLAGPDGKAGEFGLRQIWDAGQVGSLSDALLIAAESDNGDFEGTVHDTAIPFLNHAESGNPGGGGFFADDEPLPAEEEGLTTDDFIIIINGIINHPGGTLTIGTHTDDGFGFRLVGQEFGEVSGGGAIDLDCADIITHVANTGDSNTRAIVSDLPAGNYEFEMISWERGGGAYFEVYAALGEFFEDGDTDEWALIGDVENGGLELMDAGPVLDTDEDGMPDSYEIANELDINVDDSGEDKDGDGLTNIEEFQGTRDAEGKVVRPQTFANKADSDEDGLSDKVESNTGTFVSVEEDTGTHPRRDDTDRDGLNDGVESNSGVFVSAADPGTNPLNEDTDGDKFKDGREVEKGTNPLDASDPPPPDPNNIVSGYWPLDADLIDASGNGGDGELMDGEDDIPDFVEGKLGGGALSLDGVSEFVEINPDLEDLYSGFDVDAGEPDVDGFTVSAWFKVGLWDKSWQCLVAKGEGNRWRVHRRGGEATITGNGGNGDVPAGTIEPEDDEWHLVVLISNPDLDLAQVWVDGELEGENSGLNVEDNANPMMIGENPDARNRTWNGLVDDVAFFNRALTEEEHLALWNDGEGATVGEVFLGATPGLGLRVTNVQYVEGADGAADQVEVTWASKENATYAVDSSQTIPEEADGWEEAADGVDSGGEETSFTVPVPADATSLYVRVREE